MILKPEGDKVIVRPDTVESITKGGLIVPDEVQSKYQTAATRGTIEAIGPQAELRFLDDDGVMINAKVGDRVIFSKYGGSSIKVDRIEYRVLFDKDIVCLIDGDEEGELPDSRKSMVK